MEATVGELAALVGGTVVGEVAAAMRGVADLRKAGERDVGFVREARYVELARASGAGCIVVPEDLGLRQPQIVVADAHLAFARIATHFHPRPTAHEHAIHATACVDPSAELEPPVAIGPHAMVGASTRIGRGSVLMAGACVGAGVRLGRDCLLYPRVVVYDGVEIGDRVTLHAGCVVGSDGFGYVPDRGAWSKIPQIGTVRIDDDVEIGANTAIDRGALGETRIGAGTKIDNLVHIGHNCVLGRDNAIAGFSAFSGSTVLGDRVTVAGHTVFAGHCKVASDTRIGGNSVVYGDIAEAGDYIGYPLMSKPRWARTLRVLAALADLQPKLRSLLGGRRGRARGQAD